MAKRTKETMARELASRYARTSQCVIVDYTGLTARESNDLRRRLREQGARMEVLRNRIAARAFEGSRLEAARDLLAGPSALVSGPETAALCKLLAQWSKEHGKLAVRGGVFEGRRLSAQDVEALAALPPLSVLRAQAATLLCAPLVGLASALQMVHRKIAVALEAIRKNKAEAQGAPTNTPGA